jgi:3-dehydroquinate synthase
MVDAAIGGKTGINTPQGKNLVGAFHSPAAVLADLDYLATLPVRDYVAGLAEVVKAGFIRDAHILHLLESDPRGAATVSWPHAADVIGRAIKVKVDVVAADPFERMGTSDGREVLNYGHTFGHAIEQVEAFRWRHGDAVAVGMVFVAELAAAAHRMTADLLARHRDLLRAIGLPTTYPPHRWGQLHEAMRLDKKSRGAALRFVILEDVGRTAILDDPDPALLFAAYQRVSEA